MQKALSTLPWVEVTSIRGNTGNQTVRFGFKDAKSWDEQSVRNAIEGNTNFKTGKVLEQPIK